MRVLLIFVLALFCGSAHSSLVEYRYEGRNFNYFESTTPEGPVYDTSNKVTFSLFFDAPLISRPWNDVRTEVVSFTATDGDLVITNESASFRQFYFQTDATGIPELWSLGAYLGDRDNTFTEIATGYASNSFTSVDGASIHQKVPNSTGLLTLEKGRYLYPIGEFGTWSVRTVDNPAPIALLGFGLIAIVARRLASARR